MTEKELKKLTRTELLEMLLELTRENDRLKADLDAANEELKDRKIRIEKAGSIAEASLALSGIFEKAQEACDLFLENIKESSHEKN